MGRGLTIPELTEIIMRQERMGWSRAMLEAMERREAAEARRAHEAAQARARRARRGAEGDVCPRS